MYIQRFCDIILKIFQIRNIVLEKIFYYFYSCQSVVWDIGFDIIRMEDRRMNQFFTADYRDGRVRIGNKTYAAGNYAVHLFNIYYKNDTAARLSV